MFATPVAAQVTTAPAPRDPAAFEALYRARLDSARLRFTAADVRFMRDMIHHHAQAVTISQWAPTHGASASIRTLAARIINAQRDEIALMIAWLRDRKQPAPALHEMDGQLMVHEPAGDGAAMSHDGHAGHAMPGMLSDAQLKELDAARGAEFDRLFLTYMIAHHKGAVTMVDQLFATDGAGQDEAVFKFASDVQVDQRTEVQRMELMLGALRGGAPSR
ncbi:MAG: DUF305 domain-containing protein [Gemmatimonadaceae bacterium]|nr:DUF305 domain-containing protein [Gemmatimonadaceae bacterium]